MAAWVIPAAIAAGQTLLSYLGGQQAKRQRQKQFDDFIRALTELEAKTRRESTQALMQAVSGQAESEGQGAARRALALGRGGQTESFVLPARGQVLARGSETLRDLLLNISNQFAGRRAAAEQEFAGRPIEPGIFDYLSQGVGAGANLYQTQEFLDSLKPKAVVDPNAWPEGTRFDIRGSQGTSPGFSTLDSGSTGSLLAALGEGGGLAGQSATPVPPPDQYGGTDTINFLINQFRARNQGRSVRYLSSEKNPLFPRRRRQPWEFSMAGYGG